MQSIQPFRQLKKVFSINWRTHIFFNMRDYTYQENIESYRRQLIDMCIQKSLKSWKWSATSDVMMYLSEDVIDHIEVPKLAS